ncbi:MAG: polysaccharide deacetylase family protein [Hyphomicrobiaceae bacterium]
MIETLHLATGSDPAFLPRLDRKLARTILRSPATLRVKRTVVTFSFDDIPRQAATVGAEILEDAGVRGTFFIAAGLLGKRFGPWQFAEMEDIVSLHAAGHEIGSHTFSHPDCQRLSLIDLHKEIESNAAALNAAMPDLELQSFAYPYGSVGCLQKRALLHEFACSRGTHPDINAQNLDIGQLNSFTLNDDKTPVARIKHLIDETTAANGWLMFHTHDVCDRPTSEDCSPSLLRAAVEIALSAGCTVLPIRDALGFLESDRIHDSAKAA